MSIWIYRNINISILVLSPFASSLHARRCCVFRKHGETAQEQSFSSLQSSKGERSNILQGRCQQHPILRMLHTFCFCHMVYKTTRKEYGILYLCLYLYCRIGILLYCCISVLSYYSLYLLFAIRLYIFFYIYISVSVSYVQPQFFSIGCAVNHHRQLFNVQRYGSPGRHQTPVDALPIGEDFLQQTSAIRDWVFYKNSLPIVWLTALLGCHLLKHVKRLR